MGSGEMGSGELQSCLSPSCILAHITRVEKLVAGRGESQASELGAHSQKAKTVR